MKKLQIKALNNSIFNNIKNYKMQLARINKSQKNNNRVKKEI